jgi:6,7-dimethyl-8-ribityllumazine synthase
MLKKLEPQRSSSAAGACFAIVASKYNEVYVNSMLRAAKRVLLAAKAKAIDVVRVPGAFEIPVVAAELANLESRPYAAIICLGVILRGATSHAQHIGEAVSNALMEIQVTRRVPIIHEVLLLENKQQAIERCLDPNHNRGAEAAQTALEIARLLGSLRTKVRRASDAAFKEFVTRAEKRRLLPSDEQAD